MRNYLATLLILLVLVVLVTACAPVNTSESSGTLSSLDVAEVVTVTPVENTAVPATATLLPTSTPTLAPTLVPARFDRTGYRLFAITRSYFPGFEDFRGERSYSEISSALSPDGNQIAISACWGVMSNLWTCETRNSGFLVVVDVNTGELMNDIPLGNGWPGLAAFTPDGKYLLFSTEEYKIVLWDLTANKSARVLLNLPQSGSTIYPDVAIAPDGSSMSAVANHTLYVWDSSGELLLQTPAYNARATAALSYSSDGSRLILYSSGRAGVDIYNTSNWEIARSIVFEDIRGVEISPDGRFVAGLHPTDHIVIIWGVASGERLTEFSPGIRVYSLQFNQAGDLLLVAGPGILENPDDYSTIGMLYETQTWSYLDTLRSFTSEGKFGFNRDGSRMVILGSYANTVWELPDAQLVAGYEVVQQFQGALAAGDYDAAASLFEVTEGEEEYLLDMGIDPNDLAGSFSTLCEAGAIFCHPLQELVLMGYDYDTMTYLVRLEDTSGNVFTSPEGATIVYIYLEEGADGKPRVIYPALE
jgi:DNA-binding beta-propeller fold protein YncE